MLSGPVHHPCSESKQFGCVIPFFYLGRALKMVQPVIPTPALSGKSFGIMKTGWDTIVGMDGNTGGYV